MRTAWVGRLARSGLLAVAALALVALVPGVSAQGSEDVTRARSDLGEVQRRIRLLEQAIVENQAALGAAEKRRVETERAVSAARRRLRELEQERSATEAALSEREAEGAAVAARISSRQSELAAWLRRQYLHGASNVAPFLAARDPNQLARDLHYLEQLGRARVDLIEALRDDLRESERLAAAISVRRDELARLEADQRGQAAELERLLVERSRAADGLKSELARQRESVTALRQDEEQLGRVLELLARRHAEREAERRLEAARRAEAEAREARAAASRAAEVPVEPARTVPPREPAVGRATERAELTPTGLTFAQLQGRMRFPVRGELIGRFGAPRADGGTRWRGVFIRARGGEEVVAVAPGEVVYSDWLRGYGNLIIIDHGSEYMTIYGYNDTLYKEVGERIAAGTAIATVGASGSTEESGLYFEIRHRGQPVDPLKWVRAN